MSWPWRRSRSGWAATRASISADELLRPSKRELGLDPLLFGEVAQLIEASDLGLREGLVGKVGEGLPAPESKRLAEAGGGELGLDARERLAPLGEQALEAGDVEALRIELEPIARRTRAGGGQGRGACAAWRRRPRPCAGHVAGGDSPQSSSTISSMETTAPRWRQRSASKAR